MCNGISRLPKKLLTFIPKLDIMIWQIDASVAQSVVHLTRNEKVACSSQVTSSKKASRTAGFFHSKKWPPDFRRPLILKSDDTQATEHRGNEDQNDTNGRNVLNN